MILRILLVLVCFGLAFIIPFHFEKILIFSVSSIGLGWVLSTILIRVLVILLVSIALFKIKALAGKKLQRIKSWMVVLIALVLGFGISFISPIYNVDYGSLSDDKKLENLDLLEAEIDYVTGTNSKYCLVAFFTTGCPHCKAASERLGVNIDAGQKTEVVAIFPGTQEDTDKFLKKHKGQKFNSRIINNDALFVGISGGAFPSMFLLDENGNTLNHWTGDELNYTALDYLKSLE